MRMIPRTALVVIGCWLAFSAAAPIAARAQQSAAAAVESDRNDADMPGCTEKANGAACCASASCQAARNAAADTQGEGAKPAGCPCQRARQAAAAAAAAQAAEKP